MKIVWLPPDVEEQPESFLGDCWPRDAWGTGSKSWHYCPEGEAVFPPHTSLLWWLLVAGTSGSQMEIPSRARLWEEPHDSGSVKAPCDGNQAERSKLCGLWAADLTPTKTLHLLFRAISRTHHRGQQVIQLGLIFDIVSLGMKEADRRPSTQSLCPVTDRTTHSGYKRML